jgi:molybdopterin synthase sulfur carrier subunit
VQLRLLFFAALRDATGFTELDVSLPEGVTDVSALRDWIVTRFPSLLGRLGTVRVAVNEAFVDNAQSLAAGDVVAFIPPVSGG